MQLKIKAVAILAMMATGVAYAGQNPLVTSQDIYETQDAIPLSSIFSFPMMAPLNSRTSGYCAHRSWLHHHRPQWPI